MGINKSESKNLFGKYKPWIDVTSKQQLVELQSAAVSPKNYC